MVATANVQSLLLLLLQARYRLRYLEKPQWDLEEGGDHLQHNLMIYNHSSQ